MTPEQRIATAHRATEAWNEFIAPMIAEMKAAYTERMVEVANSELNAAKRADKITALSNALKIATNLESGMLATITDGEMAYRDMLRADKVERMTAPQRRLFNIAGH